MFINKALMLCNFPTDKSEYRLDERPTFVYACEGLGSQDNILQKSYLGVGRGQGSIHVHYALMCVSV